ncbi:unnamed protein product [Miscanthus lutarioriparius]|uniref:Pentatricopeptide repeat-containing protein n=1 Tax=Miscanthus lutarioriparius TaxID=422564 RepID=A0A811SP93_9POAL|nr:unnamed protein product [Miscanthus lutarioriparius]
MGDFHHTWLKARKVFVRMLSSEGGASVGCDTLLDASDLAKRLCKLIISCRKASALEHELDHSGIRVTPEVAERVLERLDNAGMLAYRFFEWTRRQKRGGCAHTVRSYHTVVVSLAKIRQYQLMWDVVAVMRKEGAANVETFGIIMRKYARAQKFDEAVYTFNIMERYGVAHNLAAFNSLLGALCKSKNVRKAQEIFDKMNNRFSPDAKTYSILLEGWGESTQPPKDAGGRVEEAVCVVQDMSSRGCQPTTFIYSVLVHTYGVDMRIEDAVATFLDMEKDGIVPDVVVYNALVTAFCKVKKFDNAFRVMDDMEGHGISPQFKDLEHHPKYFD